MCFKSCFERHEVYLCIMSHHVSPQDRAHTSKLRAHARLVTHLGLACGAGSVLLLLHGVLRAPALEIVLIALGGELVNLRPGRQAGVLIHDHDNNAPTQSVRTGSIRRGRACRMSRLSDACRIMTGRLHVRPSSRVPCSCPSSSPCPASSWQEWAGAGPRLPGPARDHRERHTRVTRARHFQQ